MSDLDALNAPGQELGMHETWENRDACVARYRNEGLFVADQNPGGRSIHTRALFQLLVGPDFEERACLL